MELNSEQKINAPREAVFAALNDPEILRQCIPGCESLDKESDTEMSAMVTLKIGPVKARFKGRVEISNLVPPESYSISGQGSGGASGFAKGGADITLIEIGDATLLQYEVKAEVGGRLAQLGGRLCLPFISSGVHQERRPVRRHWCWHHLRCEAGIVIFGNDAHIDRQSVCGTLPW